MSLTLVNPEIRSSNVTYAICEAGEAISQSAPVYKASDGTYYQSYASTESTAECAGIAMTAASSGGFFIKVSGGLVMISSDTLTINTNYCVGHSSGTIDTYSNLTSSTDYVTFIGTAVTTSEIEVNIYATGALKS